MAPGRGAAGFPPSLTSQSGSTTLDSHSYTRDAVGNVLQEVIGGPTSFTSSFGFDDLYRPVSATDPTGSYSWSYDADNNRASQTVNGATTSYTVDAANHLTSVGGVAVTTDANGNITADNTGKSYQWDARGRLTSVSQNGTVLASYTYATNGTRSSMTEGGVTTTFTLDGSLCVNEAVGSSNTPTLFGPTGPISRGTQWFTPDASGSIAAVTDNTGLQVAQNCYGLFGQMATTNPSSGDPLQYLGGMADQAAGGKYLGGRGAWSPNLGQDIGGFTGGVLNCVGHAAVGTLTSFANYNPLSPFIDPIVAVGHFVQSVRQKGLAQAILDPITDTLQQLGDFSSPEAAGNSLCNDTLVALPIVGAVGGGGGGGVDVPPVETPPAMAPPVQPTTAVVPSPPVGTTIYRVFGGDADLFGHSWTPVDPRTVPDYRNGAGLYPGNWGDSLATGILVDNTGVTVQASAPGPGGVGGGLTEYVVPDPLFQVHVIGVVTLSPPL